MTMFCDGLYGGGGGYSVGSDMADDSSVNESSSKEEREEEWLQLSIGLGKNNGSASGLVELDLMPTSTHSQMRPDFRPPRPVAPEFRGFSPSFFLPQQHHNWPIPITSLTASQSQLARPLQMYDAAAGASPVDFRVLHPPRRPHSGIWFMLQASHNQEREPFLPQISKSYLRIKDGRMTIRLVIKYLVNKLSLENESEIEIRCKGQRLLPFLTLQHVRDNIWSNPRDFITLLPNSSTTHHIMVLHYARTDPSN